MPNWNTAPEMQSRFIFCYHCKHYRVAQDYSPDYCAQLRVKTPMWNRVVVDFPVKMHERNRFNDCPGYIRSWYKFWREK